MALKKASSSSLHPAMPVGAAPPAPEPTIAPAAAAEPVEAAHDGGAEQATPAGQVLQMRQRAAAPEVVEPPAPAADVERPLAKARTSRGAQSAPPASPKALSPTPATDGGGVAVKVRRVAVSKRGKRAYTYAWATTDVKVMRDEWKRLRPVYRKHFASADPEGEYRLGFSSFLAVAVAEGLKTPAAWLGQVRNDARKERPTGGREQVGLVWSVTTEAAVIDAFEEMDARDWPSGFSLTKQNLAAAAILHGLRTADTWILSVPNDDRFSVPVETDGRLKANTGA